MLRCPHCHGALGERGGTLQCPSGHSFDVARQGYVNLTVGRPPHAGDSAEMLDARAAVLAAGHLDAVSDALVASCADLAPGVLVEAGAGTGHHLTRVRRALGQRRAVAMDVSVPAARRAARADPGWTTAVVADVSRPWPLLDGVAAAVLTVFAPRNLPEAARALTPGGLLVTVTPAAHHLSELAGPLGLLRIEEGKRDRLLEQARPHFDVIDSTDVGTTRVLDREAARGVAAMGPSAHHIAPAALTERLARLPDRLDVTVAVEVTRFRPRRSG